MKDLTVMQKALSFFYGLAVVVTVKLIAFSYFLRPAWEIMERQGILRPHNGGMLATGIFILTIFLGMWALVEFAKRAEDMVDTTYYGFLVGILTSLPAITNYFFYQFQWQVPIVSIASNVIGFGLAGLVFGYSIKIRKS